MGDPQATDRPRYRPLDIPRADRVLPATWTQRVGALLLDAFVFVVTVALPVVLVIWWRYGLTPDCDVTPTGEVCRSPGGDAGARLSTALFWSLTAVFLVADAAATARGGTLGTRATHCLVVDERTGRPLPTGRALLRLVVRPISVVLLGAGYWGALFDRRRRTWHDRVAGARVIAP